MGLCMDFSPAPTEGLRSKIRSMLMEMHTDVNDVDDIIQGFEKKLENIANRLEKLEERLRKIEELLGNGGEL